MRSGKSIFSIANLKLLSIFLTAIITIVLASVLVINYARGYLPTVNGIVETGSVRVNAEPIDVVVQLNGNNVQLTNKLLTNLQPGTYTLSISKEGYLPWEKSVEVSAGIVKDVFVKLFPVTLNLKQYSHSDIQKLVFSSNSEYVYYVVTKSEKSTDLGIWRQNLSDPTALSIFNGGNNPTQISKLATDVATELEDGEYSIQPSWDNRKLLLKLNKGSYYILDADKYNEPSSLNQLERKLGYTPQEVSWFNSDALVLRSNGLLAYYSLLDNKSTIIRYNPTSDVVYAVGRNTVYYYDEQMYVFNGNHSQILTGSSNSQITNVKHIYTGNIEGSFYYSTDANLFYVNSNKNYIHKLLNGQELVNMSNDASVSLIKEADQYYVFTADILNPSKYQPTLTKLNLPDLKQGSLKLTAVGNNLLYRTQSGDLYIADKDGSNRVKLLDSKTGIVDNGFEVGPAGNKVYVLLKDTLQNLYYLDLK